MEPYDRDSERFGRQLHDRIVEESSDPYRRDWRPHPGLLPGIVLVGLGALFFLNNLHIVYIRDWVRFWPAILIAVGIVKLVDSPDTGGRTGGGILVGIGGVLMAQTLGYLDGLTLRDMWPLILIVIGVVLLLQRSFDWRPHFGNHMMYSGNKLHESAVFGGGKRQVVTENFKGGTISAVFGGFEIDLRKATMEGDSAKLQVDAVFGGVEIRIPENWSAIVQGTGVFGGYTDESIHPNETVPGFKRLIIKGGAVFGGVVVKN